MRRLSVLSSCCALLLTMALALPLAQSQEKPAPPAAQTMAPRPLPEVQALLDKAKALRKEKKWPDALKGFEEALATARQRMDKSGEASALYNLGIVCLDTGQPQKALENFEQALPIYRAIGDKRGEASMLGNIGAVYNNSGQSQKQLAYYEQALTIFRAVGDKRDEASMLGNIGLVYNGADQPQKAITYFEQALPLYQAVGDKRGEVAALNHLGNVYRITGQMQKALTFYEQTLTICRAIGDKGGEANALSSNGVIYRNIGQPQKALACQEQALSMYRMTGDKGGEAAALNNIGIVYYDTGYPQKALVYYEQALPIYRVTGAKDGAANTLNHLGIVNANIGQPQKALTYFEQALPHYRAVGDKNGQASTLNNLGNVYSDTGQPQKALTFYEQALAINRAVGNKSGEAGALSNIGKVCHDNYQPQKALAYYEQALQIRRATGDKSGEATTLYNIGNVYSDAGQPQKALAYYEQVLPILRTIGDRGGEATTLNNLGLVYDDTGQPQKALAYYEQALQIRRAVGDKSGQARTLNNLGIFYYETGQLQKALAYCRQGLDLREKFRGDIGTDSNSKQAFLVLITEEYDRYIALLYEQKQPEEAFAWAQKTKARSLLDLLKNAHIDLERDLSSEELDHLVSLRQDMARLNKEQIAEGLHSPEKATERFKELGIQLAKALDALEEYRSYLYRKHPGLAKRAAVQTLSQSDLPRLLTPDTALLEYVALKTNQSKKKIDKTLLFVATLENGQVRLNVVPISISQSLLAEQCQDFREACADKSLRAYRGKAQELYSLIIAPAAKQIAGKKRLLICPDGALWTLPFQALVDGNGQHLWERYELAFAYSATGALAAKEEKRDPNRPKPTQDLLAIANPDFGDASRFDETDPATGRPIDRPSRPIDIPSRDLGSPAPAIDKPSRAIDIPSRLRGTPPSAIDTPSRGTPAPAPPVDVPSHRSLEPATETVSPVSDLYGVGRAGISPLPGTKLEAQELRMLFPGATLVEGKEAQEEKVKQEMSKYRYLHFATHGLFNNSAPMLSSIVLAQPDKDSKEDGFLTASELFEMKLSADLVTLSACETARGEVKRGEGVVGLTWALFAAGCPSAVVSQWKVDDASTPELMNAFYSGLKQGAGKGAALRKAALKLLHDGSHSHPYFWAPFILVGDWN